MANYRPEIDTEIPEARISNYASSVLTSPAPEPSAPVPTAPAPATMVPGQYYASSGNNVRQGYLGNQLDKTGPAAYGPGLGADRYVSSQLAPPDQSQFESGGNYMANRLNSSQGATTGMLTPFLSKIPPNPLTYLEASKMRNNPTSPEGRAAKIKYDTWQNEVNRLGRRNIRTAEDLGPSIITAQGREAVARTGAVEKQADRQMKMDQFMERQTALNQWRNEQLARGTEQDKQRFYIETKKLDASMDRLVKSGDIKAAQIIQEYAAREDFAQANDERKANMMREEAKIARANGDHERAADAYVAAEALAAKAGFVAAGEGATSEQKMAPIKELVESTKATSAATGSATGIDGASKTTVTPANIEQARAIAKFSTYEELKKVYPVAKVTPEQFDKARHLIKAYEKWHKDNASSYDFSQLGQ